MKEKNTYSPFQFGLKLGLMDKDAYKHLRQFETREDRLDFCRGYSAGISALNRKKGVLKDNEI